jgi:N-acetylglucosaminyldiphosphoundecaprenol N-acetyl-beta-D-mannosaminyltransferase
MGYYGARNLGDELMLRQLKKWLQDQRIDVEVLAEDAGQVERQHGIVATQNVPLLGQWSLADSWLRGKALRVINKIRQCDVIVGGGGDCIRDDVSGWNQFAYSIEKYVLALLLGKKIALLNVGLRQPKSRQAARLLAWVLQRSSLTVVRDAASYRYALEAGGKNVQYAPDIVTTLPESLKITEQKGRPYLLVCLRQPQHYGLPGFSNDCLDTIAHSLDSFLYKHNLNAIFMPCQSLDSNLDDNVAHANVLSRMALRQRAKIVDYSEDLSRVADLFGNASLVVGMRLHAAILAVAYGRRCVGVSYDRKLDEFCAQAGIGKVGLDQLNSPAFLEALERCIAGPLRVNPLSPASDWDNIRLNLGEESPPCRAVRLAAAGD